MSDTILLKLQDIIAEQLDVKHDDIGPEKSFTEDLRADSLAIVELVLAIEEAFAIKIPDSKVGELNTVGDLVAYVKHSMR